MRYIAIVSTTVFGNVEEMLDFCHLESVSLTIEVECKSFFEVSGCSCNDVTLNGIIVRENVEYALRFTTEVIEMQFERHVVVLSHIECCIVAIYLQI